MMRRLALAAMTSTLVAAPAFAQHDAHAGHDMPAPVEDAAPSNPHAHHHPAVARPADAKPPPAPRDHAADRIFGAAVMERSRAQLRLEHGDMRYAKVLFETLDYRPSDEGDAIAWDAEASYGGDIDRLTLKTEGEVRSGKTEAAEVQALYSRAIDPYFNLQVGLRRDFAPRPRRTYAVLGVEGLAPYWIELEASAFLSDHGEASARVKGSYDLRLTQKLILQPRVEADFSAEDVADLAIGSGLTKAEAGLRLRYALRPEFAPYVGVVHERHFGRTADFARTAGEPVRDTRLVFGLRTWF
jgi:copper resistance protein B